MLAMAPRQRADRLERMTNLVLVLLETPRPLSLREIASSVVAYPEGKEACRQAFERDKRALRELGIPISVEPITGEEQLGYRIHPEDYYLPELTLEPSEAQALHFAVAAVRLGGGAGRDALAKLGSSGEVPEPALRTMAVLPALPALGILHQAVREKALVSFGYRGRRRLVEPYGLVFKLTAWYLVGHDRNAADSNLRRFRVDRLEDMPVIGDQAAFEMPVGFDLSDAVSFAPWQLAATVSQGGGDAADGDQLEATTVVMVVDARMARSVVATIGAGSVEAWEPNGAVRLSIPVTDQKPFVDWVVGLGDTAVVLGPPEVRAAVIARLSEMAQVSSANKQASAKRLSPSAKAAKGPITPVPGEPGTSATADGESSGAVAGGASTAGERLNRLLAILVYLARVREARLDDLAHRFSVSSDELLHDLELAACCGVPPYTPDQLIDLLIDEDRVVAEGLRELAHPRRFTPEEGFALAAACRALLAVPGSDTHGDLAGALAKLEAGLGTSRLAVELDAPPVLADLQAATSCGHQVEIDYFAGSALTPGARVVDPYQVVVRQGKWYLDAWCHKAKGLRRFQVDRIRSVKDTGRSAECVGLISDAEREALARPEAFLGAPEAQMARIALPAEASFAVEPFLSSALEELGDGLVMATIPVSGVDGWFGRLMLQLGPRAEVIAPSELASAGAGAASRALERYEQ
jgi:predicted DNA-binding transcriptional regulator YafY